MNTPTIPQFIKLLQTMEQKGVTLEILQDRFQNGALADIFDPAAKIDRTKLRAALGLPGLGIGAFPGATLTPFGLVEFDASKPLPGHIAAGRYDWVNDAITAERFPLEGEGVLRLETAILHFGCDKSSEAVVSAVGTLDEANPWRVAGIGALCAFGAKNPEEQRKRPIVALGSVGKVLGVRRVPCLGGGVTERFLGLGVWSDVWFGYYRFLLVRSASASAPQA